MGTLLTTDIKDTFVGQVEHGLQRQCGLANTWFATQQNDAARYQSAAQHTIQLCIVHVDAYFVLTADVSQPHGTVGAQRHTCLRCCRCSRLSGCVASNLNLLEGVPLSASRTLANPFGRLLSAVLADVCYFVFCHREVILAQNYE